MICQLGLELLGLELIWGEGFSSVQINSSKLVRELLRDHFKEESSRPNKVPKVPVDPTYKFSKNDVLIIYQFRTKRCRSHIGRSLVWLFFFLKHAELILHMQRLSWRATCQSQVIDIIELLIFCNVTEQETVLSILHLLNS